MQLKNQLLKLMKNQKSNKVHRKFNQPKKNQSLKFAATGGPRIALMSKRVKSGQKLMSVAIRKHKKLNNPKLLQNIKMLRRTLKTFCQLQYLILRKKLSKLFEKKRKLHAF